MRDKTKKNHAPKTKKNPKGAGRPKAKIDFTQLEELCKIQCTLDECSAILGVSHDTLERRVRSEGYDDFASYFAKHSSEGKASLRRTQHKVATVDENVTMLIHLGKQYLGQSDKTESKVNMKAEVKEGLDALYDDMDEGKA